MDVRGVMLQALQRRRKPGLHGEPGPENPPETFRHFRGIIGSHEKFFYIVMISSYLTSAFNNFSLIKNSMMRKTVRQRDPGVP